MKSGSGIGRSPGHQPTAGQRVRRREHQRVCKSCSVQHALWFKAIISVGRRGGALAAIKDDTPCETPKWQWGGCHMISGPCHQHPPPRIHTQNHSVSRGISQLINSQFPPHVRQQPPKQDFCDVSSCLKKQATSTIPHSIRHGGGMIL